MKPHWTLAAAFLLVMPCALRAENDLDKLMSGAGQKDSAAGAVLQPPAECCTPQATAKIAAAAGFIDIAGIKLGMPAKKAASAIKKVNRKFEIILSRLTSNWDNLARLNEDTSVNMKKRWLTAIQGDAKTGDDGSETMLISLTDPPNDQVVSNISRQITFPSKSRPTLEKIISGLRTKYGPESLGPDVSDSGLKSTFDSGTTATLLWFFDSEGRPLKTSAALVKWYKETGRKCAPAAQLSYDFSVDTPQPVAPGPCANAVILQAQINHPPRPGFSELGWKLVSDMAVTATHYPLHSSSIHATAAWLAEARQNQEKKQTQDAERVKTPKL